MKEAGKNPVKNRCIVRRRVTMKVEIGQRIEVRLSKIAERKEKAERRTKKELCDDTLFMILR